MTNDMALKQPHRTTEMTTNDTKWVETVTATEKSEITIVKYTNNDMASSSKQQVLKNSD